MQDSLEVNLGAIKCGSAVEQYQEMYAISNFTGEMDRKARRPWMTQEIISKMNKGIGRVSTMKKEGRITED
jgi:hypothetical protein